jgi:hypothetical protein
MDLSVMEWGFLILLALTPAIATFHKSPFAKKSQKRRSRSNRKTTKKRARA